MQPLFARLIDDAGLFPPARKSMERAGEDHRRARAGAYAWMLGRFLCPASRLEELPHDPWEIGVVFDGADWRADLERVRAFSGPATITALELRLPADPAAAAAALAATGAAVFLEVPSAAALPDLAALGVGAKLRCGGPAPEAFPPPGVVAAFVRGARELRVPFKLTAGLHHPFRTRDEDLGVLQHGFVNLLAATALDVEDLEMVVAEPDASAFRVDADGLSWRDARAGPSAIERARRLFTAYGSCSFDEPVDDLVAAGILSAGAPAGRA